MFQPRNIFITCSKSGKLTKSPAHCCFDMVLAQNAPKKCLFLWDTCPTQGDLDIYKKVPGCQRLAIPQKTTDRLQPLNLFYNRQMKSIICCAYDCVILDQLPITMSTRDNIIRLVSIMHNRMSAKVVNGLIHYAWFASDIRRQTPSSFQNGRWSMLWGAHNLLPDHELRPIFFYTL